MPAPKKQPISDTTIDFAAETLVGDVQAFLVDRLRAMDTPFKRMNEAQQAEVIDGARRTAETLVRQAVQIIASDGRESIPVQVEKVANDGKLIKISIEASRQDEHRHALFDAAGYPAFLTVAAAEKYMGGEEPKPEPDQRELPEAAE